MGLKPGDTVPALPEQPAVVRASHVCNFLSQILPEAQFLEVRKAVFAWDVANCPQEAASERGRLAVIARWEKRRA